MMKKIMTITLLVALAVSACNEAPKEKSAETSSTEVNDNVADEIVTSTYVDKDENKLEVAYNNTKGIATFVHDGDTINLEQQKSASGFWFKNENYELTGKGNDIELKKGEQVIFSHTDDIVTSSLKDKDGQTLNVTINKTVGTAKVYLNGGEQIDLVSVKDTSIILYSNDQYELKGKDENFELTKDGKTVFKN